MFGFIFTKVAEFAAGKALDKGLEEVVRNRQSLLRSLSNQTLERGRRTRVSAAELLLLRNENGQYLLIKNQRRPQFGPIGGVIRFHPSGREELKRIAKFESQHSEGEESYDIRGYLLAQYFPIFMRWFYAERGREKLALIREIREELLEVGQAEIAAKVPPLEFELTRIIHEGPTTIAGHDYQQYRLMLIREIVLDHPLSAEFRKQLLATATAAIEESIKKKISPHEWPFIFVTAEEIHKGRSEKFGQIIADHSGYLVGKKRIGREPPPYHKK